LIERGVAQLSVCGIKGSLVERGGARLNK